MATVPIFITAPPANPQAKSRPSVSTLLDLHALGITHLDGHRIQRHAHVPPTEPGAWLEVVVSFGQAILIEHDPTSPSLLPGPVLLICDSAGVNGEVAEASLLPGGAS